MRAVCTSFLLALLLRGVPAAPAADEPPLKDFTGIKLEDTGIKLEDKGMKPVKPTKDPKTGFIVGGKNSTALIKGLTEINGIAIRNLEAEMRPGASSSKGFLGKNEKLLDILAEDNRFVVEQKGLTHQELARHLQAMGAVWGWQVLHQQTKKPFLYHGRKFQAIGYPTRGSQPSPFDDDTKSGTNLFVKNLSNGKDMYYGLLVPFMVERYGFYEGHGTPYRLEPARVLEVFDFLHGKAK